MRESHSVAPSVGLRNIQLEHLSASLWTTCGTFSVIVDALRNIQLEHLGASLWTTCETFSIIVDAVGNIQCQGGQASFSLPLPHLPWRIHGGSKFSRRVPGGESHFFGTEVIQKTFTCSCLQLPSVLHDTNVMSSYSLVSRLGGVSVPV